MAAYNTPDLNDYLPGEPWTSAKALLVVENPISFIEQDSTSPVNQAAYHPYNKVTVGDSNDGVIYDHAVSGNATSFASPVLDSSYRYLVELFNLMVGPGNATITLSLYDVSDSLIHTQNLVLAQPAGVGFTAQVEFLSDNYWRSQGAVVTKPTVAVSYFTLTAGGVNFVAGKVYLRRRKELI